MNKIGLVIKREYLSRVRKKTFILSTILTPLLFAGVIGAVIFITVKNISHEKIAVVDPAGYLKSNLENSKTITYSFVPDADTGNFAAKGFSGVLIAPHTGSNNTSNFKLVTEKSLSRFANERIEKDVSRAMENNMISQTLKIDPKLIDSIKSKSEAITIDATKRGEGGKMQRSDFGVASGIGYVTAFLIYITLFIYGVMVMRGVMEEKTNRIAEVIISSVKPFQLMIGKIIGIGAVGLTQFLIWIVLISVISSALMSMIPPDVLQQVQETGQQIPGQSQQGSEALRNLASAQLSLSTVNWGMIIFSFLFYFFGGYLFYASLFAAVGSAVNEDAQDAQSLTFPITLPIILGIVIMINSINDPSSSLATWASIVPFTSPIVMMSRIPFGVPDTVPYWQLGLSMLLLVIGFLFTTWLSAKIYRTGILLYGKKPTWKEMIKWVGR
ncbi:MAG: ABC transporter permease [Flavisolibacter sp.]|nr:ABC transporter permease [Flavisolibacter sp.]MBD0353241.1 ABC transporter permease [Flavisolibacter sp.]MBD0366530.1 ABC transporter permease [Flavisolibacter sp.]